MKFTYSSGARPLDGYTIKRGIGHGGFGEVYYALSDGGKEVALKLVRSNLDVELRGMAQCLNLKHPNLVALYDIKTDGQGDSWVIMEYIAGESLQSVLARNPQGLPPELARQSFIGLAGAVGYLHDNGIVHRDLKPANIFIENGFVKVGDYGLSKFISGSQLCAQTQSVGTVHYMAPEVSTGKYGKPIDTYAAGIILYEMLTGHVPFQGESAGEILMKHLTASPDLSRLPAGYREVVGTALAKNPSHRYVSFADMARAVEQIGAKAPVIAAAVRPAPRPVVPEPSAAPPIELSVRDRAGALCSSMLMAVVVAALAAMIWPMAEINFLDRRNTGPAELSAAFSSTFGLLVISSWAVLLPAVFWDGKKGDQWLRRGVMLLFGLGVGLAAYWLHGGTFGVAISEPATGLPAPLAAALPFDNGFPVQLFRSMTYFGAVFFLPRWWKLADRRRPGRFRFFPILLVGGIGYLLQLFFLSNENISQNVVVLALTAGIVQLVSPWQEPAPKPAKRMRLRYA